MAMKRVMMALGCAAVTMFAGCMCDQMAARDLQPKEAVECPEIRSECFSLLFENIATNRIELCGQHRFSGSKEVDELAVRDAVREAIEGCGAFLPVGICSVRRVWRSNLVCHASAKNRRDLSSSTETHG